MNFWGCLVFETKKEKQQKLKNQLIQQQLSIAKLNRNYLKLITNIQMNKTYQLPNVFTLTNNNSNDDTDDETENTINCQIKEKQPRQLKTEPQRLNYLRERKVIGRNEESQILNGLQYILVMKHDVQFEFKQEKRSKKTTKIRMPLYMTFNGIKMSIDQIRQFGKFWLVQNGYSLTADGNDNSLKELQRTKEAEINAAIIHMLDSFGYTLKFKQYIEKAKRRTSPFIKVLSLYSPHGFHYTTETLKRLGKTYDLIFKNMDY